MLRTLIFIALTTVYTLSAQIPDGSVAPPWTATDIYGQQHSLYDYLGQGKTVFIEVSATWAAPNFSYHTSGVLQELYTDYGPGGTDEVMVFMYESDASTSLADILGQGPNTMGNWSNVPFPIINDQQIIDSYQIAYYPTIFAICPDGIITEISQVGTAELYQHVGTCPELGPLNAAITAYLGAQEACPQAEYHTSVEIQNQNGYDQDVTEVSIETYVDNVLHESQTWTGTLAQGQWAIVDIAPILSGTSDFEVEIVLDYLDDEDASDDVVTEWVTLAEVAASNVLQLHIQLDQFPEETKWEFRNGAGDLVFQGGPYPSQVNESITDFIVLPYNDCFTFKMIDEGGDGLHASASGDYADGSFELWDEYGTELLSGGGDMEWGTNGIGKTIYLDMTLGLEDNDQAMLSLYPNPATDILTISRLQRQEGGLLHIFDLDGRVIMSRSMTAANERLKINVSGLATGTYILEYSGDNGSYRMPLIKARL